MSAQNPSYEDLFGKPEIKNNKIPGIDEPKIVQAISVEGNTETGGGTKTLIFSRDSSEGEINQNFEGFGFKPSSYTIVGGTRGGSQCHGAFDGENEVGIFSINYGGYDTGTSARILHLRDESDEKTYAEHYDFTDDGITLEFTDSDVTCSLIITCNK